MAHEARPAAGPDDPGRGGLVEVIDANVARALDPCRVGPAGEEEPVGPAEGRREDTPLVARHSGHDARLGHLWDCKEERERGWW